MFFHKTTLFPRQRGRWSSESSEVQQVIRMWGEKTYFYIEVAEIDSDKIHSLQKHSSK